MIKKHIANVLTILRIILTPIFLLFFLRNEFTKAGVIFAVASITDFLDGKLARRYNITDFGKFTDSLADKLLVGSALIGLILVGQLPLWIVAVILGREILITTLRIIFMAKRGKVVQANIWGKIKGNTQMFAIVFALIFLAVDSHRKLNFIHTSKPYGSIFALMCIPLIATVVSGTQFLIVNFMANSTDKS